MKLTEEELAKLRTFESDKSSIKLKIGAYEVEKAKLIRDIHAINDLYEVLEKELKAKYGENINVSLDTGEVKVLEK